MSEGRLHRTRQSLPIGYRFGDALNLRSVAAPALATGKTDGESAPLHVHMCIAFDPIRDQGVCRCGFRFDAELKGEHWYDASPVEP